MQYIQVGKLKSEFSSIIEQVHTKGEAFVIERGRSRQKVAMLVPYETPKKERVLGPMQGKGYFRLHDDFKMSEEELLSR